MESCSDTEEEFVQTSSDEYLGSEESESEESLSEESEEVENPCSKKHF